MLQICALLVLTVPASSASLFSWARRTTVGHREPDYRKPTLRSEEEETANMKRKSHAVRKRVPWALGDMSTTWASKCQTILTRKWLDVPSNFSRPHFETSFETNWPRYGRRTEVLI